ncbi:MAG: EAL domain-containing protein [Deltaproteobacteria bacterium]|nr:EAL domain-containing protein [Deltaproteobacteria bacterium]
MANESLHILLVEDNRLHAAMATDLLAQADPPGFDVTHVERLADAEKHLEHAETDLILLDLTLPDAQGMAVVSCMRNCARDIPIVILTALQDEAAAIKSLRHGAQDYLIKSQVTGDLLIRSIRHAIERERLESRVRRLAYYDALTDLPNRALFYDRINQTLALARRYDRILGVLFFDLDHFKLINDSLGHSMGDQLLEAVAARLKEVLRSSDSLARMGGDEFAVLLPEVKTSEDVGIVADRILKALELPCILEEQELFISASIGACIYPQDGDDVETLLKNADTAMYRAKQTGRSSVCYYTPTMNVKAADKLAIRNALPYARERGQLRLYYQPQAHLADGRLAGLKALLRWEHPTRGLIPQADFVPVAEETGLIVSIGDWVLQAVCDQARGWREQGLPPLRMSVRITARQLQDESFYGSVLSALERGGLPPADLELELTEADIANVGEAGVSTLRALKEHGVRIAIDDFGAGQSSFQYLRCFPVDSLKIDKSFIDELEADGRSAAIVKSIIAMGRNLGLETVAEGVESEQQIKFLRTHGCDRFQGYAFSQPKSPDELERLLNESAGRQAPPVHR